MDTDKKVNVGAMLRGEYLFTSARLGLRQWLETDLDEMAGINADPQVMEFFPSTHTREKTLEFIERMQRQYAEKGYCYFAVERLDNGRFIGFIGISEQTFELDFTPFVDIGWRIKKDEWGQGFATEGAKACVGYAFRELGLEKVGAVAPVANTRSIGVMKRIGMVKVREFDHPLLLGDDVLRRCVLYEMGTTVIQGMGKVGI